MLAVILTAALLVGFLPENAYALSYFDQEYIDNIHISLIRPDMSMGVRGNHAADLHGAGRGGRCLRQGFLPSVHKGDQSVGTQL